jgi:Flp pilus assembly protein TadG
MMRIMKELRRSELSSIPRLSRIASGERGQALIETALALPLLFVVLVGVAEFAMASYAAIEVSNAALAGVQYGAQNPATATDTAGIQTAAANDAGNLTLGPTTVSHSCICSNGGASTCQPTDCSGSNIETILTVQTQMDFIPGFRYLGLPTAFTLHGLAAQKVLQ